jgi:hypothetical protein
VHGRAEGAAELRAQSGRELGAGKVRVHWRLQLEDLLEGGGAENGARENWG